MSGFVGNIALIDPVAFGHGNSCRSYTQIVRETFANMAEPFAQEARRRRLGRFGSRLPSNDVSWRHISDVI
jgi:hypothetical protein